MIKVPPYLGESRIAVLTLFSVMDFPMIDVKNFVSNCSLIKHWVMSIFGNKLATLITLCLIVLATIKFDDIWQTFYPPSDLILARKYLDRYVALGAVDDKSCAEAARKARGETARIYILLRGIIDAHQGDSRYASLSNIEMAMRMGASASYPLCDSSVPNKLSDKERL